MSLALDLGMWHTGGGHGEGGLMVGWVDSHAWIASALDLSLVRLGSWCVAVNAVHGYLALHFVAGFASLRADRLSAGAEACTVGNLNELCLLLGVAMTRDGVGALLRVLAVALAVRDLVLGAL